MQIKQITIRIYGTVQGVFFRANAKQIADSLNLKGCVKNLEDGSVEIIAEGEEEALKNLLTWAKKGPELAKVEKVEVSSAEPSGKYVEFQVE